jgi:hypothetical protein
MAIKGKGRTRGRQPVRAPRRIPVEVKPPFFLRRQVQISLAFIAGLLVMVGVVWATNTLRKERADDRAATEASRQRAAAQEWKSQVEGALGTVGSLSPGNVPKLFPTVSTAIASLRQGDDLEAAAAALKDARANAKLAIEPLQSYDLVGTIGGKGMSEGQVNWFLNSQTRFVQSLQLYQQAAAMAPLAIDASEDQRTAIADRAADLVASASDVLEGGWQDYQNALTTVHIVQTPNLNGLSGPTG